MKEFTKKLDKFEDDHPVICGLIKVISGLGFVVEVAIIALAFC